MPKFNTPEELGRHLYDKSVKPRHNYYERIRLAIASALYANKLWNEKVKRG